MLLKQTNMMKFLYYFNKITITVFIIFSISCFTTQKKKDKYKAVTLYENGIAYLSAGELNKAYSKFAKAIELDQDYAQAHHAIGIIYLSWDEYNKAKKEMEISLKLIPNVTSWMNNLGLTYFKLKEYGKAIELFEKVLEDKTYNSPDGTLYNLGEVYYQKKELAKAISYFEKSIKRNKFFDRPYISLGKIAMENKEYRKAILKLVRAVDINYKASDGWFYLANCYEKIGNLKDACTAISNVFDGISKDDELYEKAILFKSRLGCK